jgi:ABC-2 type transport system ATP-binding protein
MKDSVRQRAASGAAFVVSSHLLALVQDLCTHLLILHRGQRLFFGATEQARAAFADLKSDASLEELFFRATESPEPQPVSVSTNSPC